MPIINENDAISTEIKLGDNDNLSALVSNLVEAEQHDPHRLPGLFTDRAPIAAQLITGGTDRRQARAGRRQPSELGTGGMT